jgi:hypothetical protein
MFLIGFRYKFIGSLLQNMYILQLQYQQIRQSSLHNPLTILNTQLSIVINCPDLYLL